jgi:hydrogenase maturation protease
MVKLAGYSIRDITIYGIEPKKLDWGLELSPEIAAIVPRVIELVLNELQ